MKNPKSQASDTRKYQSPKRKWLEQFRDWDFDIGMCLDVGNQDLEFGLRRR